MSRALAFAIALGAATVAGSIVQTQLNLAAIAAFDVDIALSARLRATGLDLLRFAPFYGLMVAVTMLVGLVSAAMVSRWLAPRWHRLPATGLPAVVLLAVLLWMNWTPAFPAVVAAARSVHGMVLLAMASAAGGWIYASLATRSVR